VPGEHKQKKPRKIRKNVNASGKRHGGRNKESWKTARVAALVRRHQSKRERNRPGLHGGISGERKSLSMRGPNEDHN